MTGVGAYPGLSKTRMQTCSLILRDATVGAKKGKGERDRVLRRRELSIFGVLGGSVAHRASRLLSL